ncbi:hypothetical protein ID1017_12650 [Helicobacter pylori]
MINELDANKLGIRHGEIVEVFNARGRLLAGAFVTKNIRQGVLSIQKGAWYDPEDVRVRNPRCNAGHVNTLTSLRPTSSMTQAISANTALVNIRKLRRYELVKPCHSIPQALLGLKRSENTTMRVFLPKKNLTTKDLTTSQAKAWGNSQFLYYNTL